MTMRSKPNPEPRGPLPEVCPHSSHPAATPQTCSLCLTFVPVYVEIRRVETDEGTVSVVFHDDEPQGLLSDVSRETQHQEKERTVPNKRKVCARCRRPDHAITECPRRRF